MATVRSLACIALRPEALDVHDLPYTSCPTKIVLRGGHSVTGFKLMILVDSKFDQVIQRSIKLTLKQVGMGGIHPLVRRLLAISHRIILLSQKFLTLSIKIPTQVIFLLS